MPIFWIVLYWSIVLSANNTKLLGDRTKISVKSKLEKQYNPLSSANLTPTANQNKKLPPWPNSTNSSLISLPIAHLSYYLTILDSLTSILISSRFRNVWSLRMLIIWSTDTTVLWLMALWMRVWSCWWRRLGRRFFNIGLSMPMILIMLMLTLPWIVCEDLLGGFKNWSESIHCTWMIFPINCGSRENINSMQDKVKKQ